jgi:predicted transcriptional regulator YdeE
MDVEIINKNLRLDIHGYSGVAVKKAYLTTASRIMSKMWETIHANKLKHKGMNIWVYEPEEKIFAGVELLEIPDEDTGLERKTIDLNKYAYHKHVGPYNLIREAGEEMREDLAKKGFETVLPYIEIYGHWTNDESKLETELLMCLKYI